MLRNTLKKCYISLLEEITTGLKGSGSADSVFAGSGEPKDVFLHGTGSSVGGSLLSGSGNGEAGEDLSGGGGFLLGDSDSGDGGIELADDTQVNLFSQGMGFLSAGSESTLGLGKISGFLEGSLNFSFQLRHRGSLVVSGEVSSGLDGPVFGKFHGSFQEGFSGALGSGERVGAIKEAEVRETSRLGGLLFGLCIGGVLFGLCLLSKLLLTG